MSDKWKSKSIKELYNGKFLKLTVEEVETPSGKSAAYEIIDRKDVAIVVPVKDESVYMVEQYRYPIHTNSLEFPQGFLEVGENPEQGAMRELQEETGLLAKELTFLGSLWISPGFLRQKLHVFSAESFIHGEKSLDEEEEGLESKRIAIQDLSSKLASGEISSAPTVAALGLYLLKKS